MRLTLSGLFSYEESILHIRIRTLQLRKIHFRLMDHISHIQKGRAQDKTYLKLPDTQVSFFDDISIFKAETIILSV